MKKQVLIVDDKSSIAKVVSIYLKKDFDFIYFDNAIKAIAWLNAGNNPDIIISDLRMPEMSGIEFIKYLKNNELLKFIPIIVLSSEDSSSEKIKLLDSGVSDYIVKPFNPMELKIRLNKILN